MKTVIVVLYLLPLLIVFVVTGILWFRDWRRHKEMMRLFDQADVVNKQVVDAIAKGDVDSASFHHERYKELSELIVSKMKKRK